MSNYRFRTTRACRALCGAAALLPILACLSFGSAGPFAAAEPPNVVASIKPIHALVAAVMAGVGEPKLLLPATASEHDYSLRPSDAAVLQKADLVFWVGPGLEGFLVKPLFGRKHPGSIALAEAVKGRLLPLRQGGPWGTEDEHGSGEAHVSSFSATGRARLDHHIWLDPSMAAALVSRIAEALAAHDPTNREHYTQNALAMAARLDRLDQEIRSQTKDLHGIPYVVSHDAYQYFEVRYGLTPVGSLMLEPGQPMSAKALNQLRQLVVRGAVKCIFREPQIATRTIESLSNGHPNVGIGELDPIGVAVPDGTEAYAQIMANLTANLNRCLKGR
jgi:zinc transport system substrate-binding protein